MGGRPLPRVELNRCYMVLVHATAVRYGAGGRLLPSGAGCLLPSGADRPLPSGAGRLLPSGADRLLPSGAGRPLFVEPLIDGPFVKWNSNHGAVHAVTSSLEDIHEEDEHAPPPRAADVPQALSHWTYVASGGCRMCCDLQGFEPHPGREVFVLVDPVIHVRAREAMLLRSHTRRSPRASSASVARPNVAAHPCLRRAVVRRAWPTRARAEQSVWAHRPWTQGHGGLSTLAQVQRALRRPRLT
jgi:hypothetical protein